MQKLKNRCCCCISVPLVIALIVFIFWGERIAADYRYAGTYKDILVRYTTQMHELAPPPAPAKEPSKKAQVAALLQRAEGTAKANEEAAHSLKLLKPPDDFKALHTSTLSLLVNTAQSCRGLAKTIRETGLESLAGGYDQLDASQRAALGQLGSALEQMKPGTPGVQSIMEQWQGTTKDSEGKKSASHK